MSAMFHSLYHRSAGTLAPKIEQDDHTIDRTFLHWPACYRDGFRAFDPDHWELEVSGLVERPHKFTLKELNGFTRIQQNRRLTFADGWAYRTTWEGFVVQELLHRVAPKPQARFLIQTSLAGHVECIPIKDLYAQRSLFCMKLGGKALPAMYGGPVRLMVFDRYAHKGIGQLAKLELSDHEIPGHYASLGYDPNAAIQPGDYYASDLKTIQSVSGSGEITQW
jgi:DMSO/TMAO reductase YedYZ molybdopterin-dependent catalytic subunit